MECISKRSPSEISIMILLPEKISYHNEKMNTMDLFAVTTKCIRCFFRG
uniref:Uncharacterized protein n=1 Tax=uncultured bacterium contig00051 TaxID=1181535 RepID=A0A806KSH4_9BACT|nr:hypothetical protein [uncultured bacterium contig00051]